MIIWLILFIPVIILVIAALSSDFRKKLQWWQPPLLLLVNILLLTILKYANESYQTFDTERYIDYVVKVEHHDYWNEWIVQTCSRECCCTTDKNGHKTCQTEYYDCSYMEEYSPYTVVITSLGKRYKYYEGAQPSWGKSNGKKAHKWLSLVKKFAATPKFVKTHRNQLHRNYGKGLQGDVYSIRWKGEIERVEYATWEHNYENRVQASNSIFRHQEVSDEDRRKFRLVDYPSIHSKYKSKAILGINSKLDEYVNQRNALIASKKQLKTYFVVFKNQPLKAAQMQEHYWQGGNKNEAVICIGLNSIDEIKWAYVFSWSKESNFKIQIRDYIETKEKLNNKSFRDIIDYSFDNLYKNFKRREFSEFSYLIVEPTTGVIITAIVLSILLSIGACFYFYNIEEIHEYLGNLS